MREYSSSKKQWTIFTGYEKTRNLYGQGYGEIVFSPLFSSKQKKSRCSTKTTPTI